MIAPISIIIPTLNSAKTLAPTLACLFEGMSSGLICEVIFADGGSTDATQQIANDIGAVFISTPLGRGTQMNTASKIAKGNWLFFIHDDTTLSQNWSKQISHHIQNKTTAAYAKLRFDSRGFFPYFIAGWANIRSKILGLPYGDQTLLISKSRYKSCGGYLDIPLMEDVAIARRLRGKINALEIVATTSSIRFKQHGWLKQGSKNLGTLLLFLAGRDPKKLSKNYKS